MLRFLKKLWSCRHDYEIVTTAQLHRGLPTLRCLWCGHVIDPAAEEAADMDQWTARRTARLAKQRAANND